MAKKRPSAAAMKRRAKELATPKPVQLSPKAADFVRTYRPKQCTDDEWAAVGPFVAEYVTRAGFTGLESVHKHCNSTAEFLLWRYRNGLSLEAEDALTHEAVDAYYPALQARYVKGTANTLRSRLHNLSSAANPGITAPSCTTLGAVSVTPGYTEAEEATIRRVALRQRNEAARRNLCSLVGFCGGAGLTNQEMTLTDTTQVDDRGEEGGIVVTVAGDRARVVVVRREYEELVRVALKGLKRGAPLLGATPGRKGAGSHAVAKAEVFDDCPRIDSRRLRTTWITWLATRHVPLNVLMAASGLTSARTLTDIVAALPPVDPTAVLRDGGVS